MRSMNAVLAA